MSELQELHVIETQGNSQIPLEADIFEKVTEELEQLSTDDSSNPEKSDPESCNVTTEVLIVESDSKDSGAEVEVEAEIEVEADTNSSVSADSVEKEGPNETSIDTPTETKTTLTKKKYYKKKFHKKAKAKVPASKTIVAVPQDENAPIQEAKKTETTVKNENQKPSHPTGRKKGFNSNNVNTKLYYQDRRMMGNYLYGPDGIPIVVQRSYNGPQVHRYNQMAKPYGNKHFVAFSPKFVPVPYEIPLSTRSNYSFKNNSNRKSFVNHDIVNSVNDNGNSYKQKIKHHKPWKYLTPVDVNEVYYGHNPFPKHYNGKKAKDNRKPTTEQTKAEETEAQNETVSIQTSEPLAQVNEPTVVAETSS